MVALERDNASLEDGRLWEVCALEAFGLGFRVIVRFDEGGLFVEQGL